MTRHERAEFIQTVLVCLSVSILGTLTALWLAGCGPGPRTSNAPSGPQLGPTSAVPGGTITYDVAATSSQVAAGAPYIARYLEHWCPPGRMQIDVTVLPDVVPHRVLDQGKVQLTYARDGTVGGTEWEIALEAQGLGDHVGWDGTWGPWGPIFQGSIQEWPQ